MRLSRFQFSGGRLKLETEKAVLQFPVEVDSCVNP